MSQRETVSPKGRGLRQWLEYVAQFAIDWLDDLDAGDADHEDDEREDDREGG